MSYVEWFPPEEPFPDDDRGRVIAYLDRQSRFDAAVWAGYRHRPGGGIDHELVLRSVEPCSDAVQRQDLFWCLSHELPVRAYIGLPTREQMAGALRVGEVVWQRLGAPPPEADPLDFRIAYEPVELPTGFRESIERLGSANRSIRRICVGGVVVFKSETPVSMTLSAQATWDGPMLRDATEQLSRLVHEAYDSEWFARVSVGSTRVDPDAVTPPKLPVLYERDAVG